MRLQGKFDGIWIICWKFSTLHTIYFVQFSKVYMLRRLRHIRPDFMASRLMALIER